MDTYICVSCTKDRIQLMRQSPLPGKPTLSTLQKPRNYLSREQKRQLQILENNKVKGMLLKAFQSHPTCLYFSLDYASSELIPLLYNSRPVACNRSDQLSLRRHQIHVMIARVRSFDRNGLSIRFFLRHY